MAEINAQMVKNLREVTGAGMMDCKKALQETAGNEEEAIAYLRKKGLKSVEKRAGKVAAEGVVFSYIHPGSRVGVLLELNSETDFVARGEDFQALAKDIAMHIAWASPKYVAREEVPKAVLEQEKDIIQSQLKPEQEKVAERIISGKLDKFYEGACLLEQIDARDPAAKKSIGDLVRDLSAKVGEKVVLRRFIRYEVGEGVEQSAVDYADEIASTVAAAGA